MEHRSRTWLWSSETGLLAAGQAGVAGALRHQVRGPRLAAHLVALIPAAETPGCAQACLCMAIHSRKIKWPNNVRAERGEESREEFAGSLRSRNATRYPYNSQRTRAP